MRGTGSTLVLYYTPQMFPCGSGSSCCGPVGQSEEEVQGYMTLLAGAFPGLDIRVQNIRNRKELLPERDGAVMSLFGTYGWGVSPVISINGDIVSMGPPMDTDHFLRLVEKAFGEGKTTETV